MLRLPEAQQLHEALNDALFRPALIAFFEEQRNIAMSLLVRAVRQANRDTMREARFAGQVEAYENALSDLEHFAKEQLKTASQ